MDVLMCTLCPNCCVISDGARGKCRIRINVNGELYSLTYGRPCAVHIDPIEKKPLFHFLPASTAFSIATAGCCLNCKYCQNWQISQAQPEDAAVYELSPKQVVERAKHAGSQSIAYTYTEPSVFFEYMVDCARVAKQQGISNVYVTCGFINQKPLEELAGVIDAANVDLKAFTEEKYQKITEGRLEPVQQTIKYLYEQGVIVEITNLIVPTLNDDMNEIRTMCRWIRDEVSPSVPLHFARFYPNYMLKNLPATPVSTLKEAYSIAQEEGLEYVYMGNVPEKEAESTYCPKCKAVLIERIGYTVLKNNISADKCPECGHRIYGKWS